jgi:D-alanyl-D-alanine carboxypeptidase
LLAAGDILTLRDLLTSALVRSSNEATVAAAEYLTQGHVPQFVIWMNEKAQMLGLQHTHFVNPHGLFDRVHGQQHYSSARDLAMITRYALTHYPLIRQIVAVGRPRPLMIQVLPRGRVPVENHNKILHVSVPGIPGAVVDGVKTGFVVEAGKCLVSSASLGKWQLIAVVLGSNGRYFQESLGLLHYGFSRYQWKSYANAQLAGVKAPVAWGAQPAVPIGTAGDLGAPVMRLEYGQLADDTVVFRGKRLSAPIQRGANLGTLTLVRDGHDIASVPAIALEAVPIAWWAWVLRGLALLGIVSSSLYVMGKLYGKIAKTRRRRRRQLAARGRSAHLSGPRDAEW